jgi:hypothetical protein
MFFKLPKFHSLDPPNEPIATEAQFHWCTHGHLRSLGSGCGFGQRSRSHQPRTWLLSGSRYRKRYIKRHIQTNLSLYMIIYVYVYIYNPLYRYIMMVIAGSKVVFAIRESLYYHCYWLLSHTSVMFNATWYRDNIEALWISASLHNMFTMHLIIIDMYWGSHCQCTS